VTLKLDHIFILTQPNAPIAEKLRAHSFVEGTSNTHPGQGTENRRFFFEGFTLEWLFITDKTEALNGAGRDLRFQQRYTEATASPFGLVVRTDSEVDFPHWLYWPDYFNGRLSFAVGNNSNNLQEPLCICMPNLPKSEIPANLCNSNSQLTGVDLFSPPHPPSEVAQHFSNIAKVRWHSNQAHKLILTFNDGAAGKTLDLTDEAKLQIRW